MGSPERAQPVPKDRTRAGREISDKDDRAMINSMVDQGWTYIPPRNGHGKLIPPNPDMPIVTVAGTPSDRKGRRLTRSKIRRSGGVL